MNERYKKVFEQFRDRIIMPRKSERQVLEHFSSVLDVVEAEDCFFKTLHLDICAKNNVPHQTLVMDALNAMGKEPSLTMLSVAPNEKSRHYYKSAYSLNEVGIYLVVEQNTGFVIDMNCNELSLDFTLYRGLNQEDIEQENVYFLTYLTAIRGKYDETFYTEGPVEEEGTPSLIIMGGEVEIQKGIL